MSSPSALEERRDELLFELVKFRFEQEWARVKDLDDKSSNLVGFVSIATSFLLGIGTVTFTSLQKLSGLLFLIFFVGMGLLIISIFFGMMALKVRKWDLVPDPLVLLSKYKESSFLATIRRTGGEMVKVTNEIVVKSNSKAAHIDHAWYTLVGGLIAVFIFVIGLVLATPGS